MNDLERHIANRLAAAIPNSAPMASVCRAVMHVLAGIYVANDDEFTVHDMNWMSAEIGHAVHHAVTDCIAEQKKILASRN